MNNRAIGIYDSGIGGLSVLLKLCKRFPNEKFVYLADTLNFPYGNKSQDEILNYTKKIISWLENTANVKLIIAACHTSSSVLLDDDFNTIKSNTHIIDIITPLISDIIKNPNLYKKICLISTLLSAKNNLYKEILYANGFNGEIFHLACPGLAELIESCDVDQKSIDEYVIKHLILRKEEEIDTLIYACTHYPLIAPMIESALNNILFHKKHVRYVDPADQISNASWNFLVENKLLNTLGDNAFDKTRNEAHNEDELINQNIDNEDINNICTFYCTGKREEFQKQMKKILHLKNINDIDVKIAEL